jgi:hypothetical protein
MQSGNHLGHSPDSVCGDRGSGGDGDALRDNPLDKVGKSNLRCDGHHVRLGRSGIGKVDSQPERQRWTSSYLNQHPETDSSLEEPAHDR